jgi:hypothetical protein
VFFALDDWRQVVYSRCRSVSIIEKEIEKEKEECEVYSRCRSVSIIEKEIEKDKEESERLDS